MIPLFDWKAPDMLQFDWLRASSSNHQFENHSINGSIWKHSRQATPFYHQPEIKNHNKIDIFEKRFVTMNVFHLIILLIVDYITDCTYESVKNCFHSILEMRFEPVPVSLRGVV